LTDRHLTGFSPSAKAQSRKLSWQTCSARDSFVTV